MGKGRFLSLPTSIIWLGITEVVSNINISMNSIGSAEELVFDDNKIKDSQVLNYIWTVIERYRERKEQDSMDCILCEEKLIHLSLIVLAR